MPVFNLVCDKCGQPERRLVLDAKVIGKLPCSKCDGVLVRAGEGPTARVIEVRDNGIMPKKVEQLANIDELIKNR